MLDPAFTPEREATRDETHAETHISEPHRRITDIPTAGEQNAVTDPRIALGCNHGNKAAHRVTHHNILLSGNTAGCIEESISSLINPQAHVAKGERGYFEKEFADTLMIRHRNPG